MEVKQIQQFLFVFANEQVKRSLVAKDFSRFTVHMAKGQSEILRSQFCETGPFREDLAKLDMASLNVWLLPGRLWITEKHAGTETITFRVFQTDGVLEFNTVVSENDGKQLPECSYAQVVGQMIKYRKDTTLCGVLQEEGNEEIAFLKGKSKQAFPASSGAFDSIHLYGREFRVLGTECLKDFYCAAPTVFVFGMSKYRPVVLSRAIGHFPRQMDILYSEDICAHVVVQCFF